MRVSMSCGESSLFRCDLELARDPAYILMIFNLRSKGSCTPTVTEGALAATDCKLPPFLGGPRFTPPIYMITSPGVNAAR